MKKCATACFRATATFAAACSQSGLNPELANPHAPELHALETRSRRIAAPLQPSRRTWQLATFALLLTLSVPAHARPWQHHGEHGGPRPAMGAEGHGMGGGFQHRNFQGTPQRLPQPIPRNEMQRRNSMRAQARPGHEHLPEWFQSHQHLTFQQQERALRRQPGFNRLGPAQRRRVLNRLRFLDSQPPAVRARILARNEAFEQLSPERRQEVRAAAQAFQRMPKYRKEQLGRAFHILRSLPPNERTAILHSARFQAEYSTRERHILSNLLSIEPWQPPQPPPPASQSGPRH